MGGRKWENGENAFVARKEAYFVDSFNGIFNANRFFFIQSNKIFFHKAFHFPY